MVVSEFETRIHRSGDERRPKGARAVYVRRFVTIKSNPDLLRPEVPSRSMKCPFCGFEKDKVVDSRESKEGESIRRRRECLGCQKRYTTYERIDEIPYMVVKKDGRREKFERQKILGGVLRACEKRPISMGQMEQIGRASV